KADEFLVCDWERQNPALESRDPSLSEVKSFISEVKRLRPKHKVLLYVNKDFWETRAKKKQLGDGLWLAWYTSAARVEDYPGWLIWQYKESPDYNKAKFGSAAEMKAWARGSKAAAPAPAAYKKPKLKERINWRKTPGGNPVRACTCMIESIEKVVEPRLKEAGIIKYCVDIWQGAYSNGSKSGNTHAGGGAVDVVQCSDAAVKIWREAGWTFWRRGNAEFGDGFDRHGHGVLRGCPHLSSAARGQLDQYEDGLNGLVSRRKDPHRSITKTRIEWDEAIEKYLAKSAPKPPASGGAGAAVPAEPEYDDDIEEFLMTANWDRPHTSKPQKLKKVGQWQYLNITDKPNISLAQGPDRVLGHVYVKINMKAGESAYFRLVEDEKDKNGKFTRRFTYEDHQEVPGTAGDTYWKFPIATNTGAPRDPAVANYLRIQWHSSDPNAVILIAGVHRYDGKKK